MSNTNNIPIKFFYVSPKKVVMRADGDLLDLLIKCLGMSQSGHDGQALTAIRKANGVLNDMGVTWEELLTQWKSSDPDVVETVLSVDVDFDEHFRFIYRHNTPSGKWTEIINSIREQWQENGHLSEKQGNLIKKFYETAQERKEAGGAQNKMCEKN